MVLEIELDSDRILHSGCKSTMEESQWLAKFRAVFDEVSLYSIVQQAVGQALVSNNARGPCTIAKQVVL